MRLDSIRDGLLKAAQHDVGNYSCYVAVAHFPGEKPRLLRRQSLAELCSRLQRHWESQARGEVSQTDVPDAIQVQPLHTTRAPNLRHPMRHTNPTVRAELHAASA